MADMKVVFHILTNQNKYQISYNLEGYGVSGSTEDVDYIITSHRRPKEIKGKEIHLQHGMGVFPYVHKKEKKDYFIEAHKLYAGFRMWSHGEQKVYTDHGFPKEKTMVLGMPYSLEICGDSIKNERDNFFLSRGLDLEKKTILYAPTWDHGTDRGFFVEWFKDGKEYERVEELCKFICKDLNCNFIIRLHEKHRYSSDWISLYSAIFKDYNVNASYLNDSPDNIGFMKYPDILIGDLSSVNVYFYVMDKPVVHIGVRPFSKKVDKGLGGICYSERAGYIINEFNELLAVIEDSYEEPSKFSTERHKVVNKYISYLGSDSKKAVIKEFDRICV